MNSRDVCLLFIVSTIFSCAQSSAKNVTSYSDGTTTLLLNWDHHTDLAAPKGISRGALEGTLEKIKKADFEYVIGHDRCIMRVADWAFLVPLSSRARMRYAGWRFRVVGPYRVGSPIVIYGRRNSFGRAGQIRYRFEPSVGITRFDLSLVGESFAPDSYTRDYGSAIFHDC
jgi:hypothetical protein